MLVFVIEAVLKILALGPIRYFRDTWNTFDFTVVALGLIEMGLEGVQGLSVLRSFRLVSVSTLFSFEIKKRTDWRVVCGKNIGFFLDLN